ncbi:MAG: serine hydrolase domain-containing protein [Bacteroidales bacterium]
MKRLFVPFMFLLLLPSWSYARKLDKHIENYIDSVMDHSLKEGFFPGAQLMVGQGDRVLYYENYGFQDYEHGVRVSSRDMYDMASCSKVIGTTLAAMRLYDDGLIGLDSRVGELLDQFRGTDIDSLSFLNLMTHVSGLRPFIPFYRECMGDSAYVSGEPRDGYRQVCGSMWINPTYYNEIDRQISESQQRDFVGKYRYSDLNLYLAQCMIERVSGRALDVLTDEIFEEMGMKHTGYMPLRLARMQRIIPTEVDSVFRKGLIRGYVHDEFAALLGGVAGHAGLFSTARDVGRFCEMVLSGGVYSGRRIISQGAIDLFTSSPYLDRGVYRGIGFDKRDPSKGVYSVNSFGHTGFTGTYFWIDGDTGLYLVLLTNRVHPTRGNVRMYEDNLRDKLWSRINGNIYRE